MQGSLERTLKSCFLKDGGNEFQDDPVQVTVNRLIVLRFYGQ